MEFRSLEEFDREFFARYGAQRGAGDQDPFLREAAPPPAEEPAGESGPLQVLYAVFSYVVIALLVVGIVVFIAPLPFGVRLLNVTSGSMRPDYPPNALLWVVPTKFEKINVGDDVTYKLDPGQVPGTNVTHRVIKIDRENGTLLAQGIHDSAGIETVRYEQVVGVVRFHVHGLGRVMYTINESEAGVYIKIAFVFTVVLLWGGFFFLSKIKTVQQGARRRE